MAEVMVIPLDAFPFLAPAGRLSGQTAQPVPSLAEGEAGSAALAFFALFDPAEVDLPEAHPPRGPAVTDADAEQGEVPDNGLAVGFTATPVLAAPPPGTAPDVPADNRAVPEAATVPPGGNAAAQPTFLATNPSDTRVGTMPDAAVMHAQAAWVTDPERLPDVAGQKPPPAHGRDSGDMTPLPVSARGAPDDQAADARPQAPERPTQPATERALVEHRAAAQPSPVSGERTAPVATDAPEKERVTEKVALIAQPQGQGIRPEMGQMPAETGGDPAGAPERAVAAREMAGQPESPASAKPAWTELSHRIDSGAGHGKQEVQREAVTSIPRDPAPQPAPSDIRAEGPAAASGATTPAPISVAPDQPAIPVPEPAQADAEVTIGRSPPSPVAMPPHAANTPDHGGAIGRQLALGLDAHRGGPVEVTLSPEELGRVRMVLQGGEAGLTLTLTAERPETLDLMRRHIDQLAQDFRDLGYRNLAFSFASEGGQRGTGGQMPQPDGTPPDLLPVDAPPSETALPTRTGQIRLAGEDRLDLRL